MAWSISRRTVKKKRKSTKPKMRYGRWDLNPEQSKFLNIIYNDKLFLDTVLTNKIYLNTLNNAVERGSYSSAPIVRGNLKRVCEEYVIWNDIINS